MAESHYNEIQELLRAVHRIEKQNEKILGSIAAISGFLRGSLPMDRLPKGPTVLDPKLIEEAREEARKIAAEQKQLEEDKHNGK